MNKFFNSKIADLISVLALSILSVFEFLTQIFSWHDWKWLFLIMPVIIYSTICQIIKLSNRIRYEELAAEAGMQNKAIMDELDKVIAFNDTSIRCINLVIKQMENGLSVLPDDCTFNIRSKFICKDIYNSLAQYTDCSKMDVLITVLDDNNEFIRTVGMAYPKGKEEPSMFNKLRKIESGNSAFLDQRYFSRYQNEKPKIEVESDFKAVQKNMYKNNGVYGQYILMPISDDGLLIGLLEIFVYSESKLKNTDEELEELAESFLGVYISQALLLYTTEKLMKR